MRTMKVCSLCYPEQYPACGITAAALPGSASVGSLSCEVAPGFGTRGLSGGAGYSVMVDGADEEENETESMPA
jgi:hypothetical protein